MSIIIRLQNLPWAADSVDIRRYFSGLSIPEGGVHIVGGEMGDAFIGFSTDEDARLAMAKDGGKIHEMQIKLLLSSRTEMMRVIERARQQNLALQAHMSPIQPPPMMPQVVPMVMPVPAPVDSDRRRGRSPSPQHRRGGRDKSPPRDRRRSPDSRRSSSKRERSRSPTRGSRGSSRDTDRRNDRYKRDDRRYDEPPRYRDDRYSGRSHSQDTKKYPENDGMNRQPVRAQGDFRDAGNRGYYDSHGAVQSTAYNYDVSRNVTSSKDYNANSYDPHSEKSAVPHGSSHGRMDMQPTANQPGFPANPYAMLPQAFNLPSYEQPSAATKEPAPTQSEEFGKRPRRSRFEPEYPSSEAPFFPQSNVEQKPAIAESVRETMPYDDKRNINQGYLPTSRNSWPQQNDNHPQQNSSWADKRGPLLEQSVQKNRDQLQVVPMDIESSPTDTPPEKIAPNIPDQYNPQRNSRPFPVNDMPSRGDSTSGGKDLFPSAKQWSASASMTVEVRGIPSDVRMKEVLDIFRNVPLTPSNVCILTNNRGAEKALIRFMKVSDFEEAMNGQPRYVRNYRCEIVPSSDAAFESAAAAAMNVPKPRHKPKPREEDMCVQLRGLPYSCKEEDIAHFFEGLTIVDMVMESSDGKCNGIAIVQLASPQDFRTALTMNGKTMGQRYITISVASKEYIAAARGVFGPPNQRSKSPPRGAVPPSNNNFDAPRPNRRPNSAPDGPPLDQGPLMHPAARPQNFCLYLTNLSERVGNKAIADFFNETGIVVKAIHLMLTPEKVPSGEGIIEVSTKEEADLALSKHNAMFLGERISVAPISFEEMTNILNGPALLPYPPGPGPLLKTPGNPRRPLIPQPPNDGQFGEHPPQDHPQGDFPPNGRPGPRGERPFGPGPPFPPGGERHRPDFPRHDRPRPDFPPERPPFFHPRGDRPRMDGPPMRGMRPPMGDRPMRPPFGRMRGPFPPRPRGPWDPRAIEQGDIGAPGCVVCIDNLHFNAGLEELLDFFKGYGLVKDNIIRKVDEHNRPTSKARVAFHNPWDAERVVRELNHKTIMGRSLKLSLL